MSSDISYDNGPSENARPDDGHPESGVNIDMGQQYGRTGWDVLHSGRRIIAVIIAMIAAAAAVCVMIFNGTVDGSAVSSFVSEYWPVAAAPALGAYLGRYAVMHMYRAESRLLLCTDLPRGTVRLLRVPEERYRTMRPAGNAFILRSAAGIPVYLVRQVDEGTGYIDYGWIHEERAEVVAVNLDAYERWRDDLTRTKVENLQLMANPKVMAAELSRKNLKEHLDRLCKALGMDAGGVTEAKE